jgi:peptide/nickel transport system substrate-binding protein
LKHRASHKLVALLVGASLVFAACSDDDDSGEVGTEEPGDTAGSETTEPEGEGGETTDAPVEGAEGGTLIWAHEQEPPDLHLDDPENNLGITSWIRQPMWEGLHGITASTEWYPELITEIPEMVENEDGTFSATYTLRDGLVWSDGDDLTADDAKYTFEMFMAADGEDEEGNPAYVYLLGDRTGYDTITDFTVTSPTEFTITWSAFFAGWQSLFQEIHPSHIFGADDPVAAAAAENVALREWAHEGTTLPSSGPMVFESWQKGVQLNMVRNETYHGTTSPDAVRKGELASVEGVQINFVTDTDAQINALLSGEAQIVMTQPQLAFEQLAESPDFTVASSTGPQWEHWGFNFFNKHLAKPEVRAAIALAISKPEVMAGLYTPLFGDLLPAEGLGNSYWLPGQPAYIDHQGEAGFGAGDIEGAQAALESAGYTQNADGIYEHPEDGVLSLRVGTTGGNRLREVQQELIQAQLKDAGIDITVNNTEGSAYFGEQPFSADALACANSGGVEGNCDIWDITQFAWQGGPWPGGQTASFRSGGGNNPYGYANAEFDALADECDATIDADARADCYNELDVYVTTLDVDPNGLVVVPLTQKPDFYGFTSQLAQAGVAPVGQNSGPLVNVVDFVFAS